MDWMCWLYMEDKKLIQIIGVEPRAMQEEVGGERL